MNKRFNFAFEAPTYACRGCGATVEQSACGAERFLGTGQELMLCGMCNLAYLAPDFTDAALDEFYRTHYRRVSLIDAASRYDDEFFRRVLSREFARVRIRVLEAALPQGARVLEIGAGFGALLGELHRLRPDIVLYATESDVAHRHMLLDGAPVTFITDAQIEGIGEFDVIVAIHALEHLKHPVEALRRYGRVLKPGGSIFIEVPDRDADWRNWLYIHPAHVSYFNAASLTRCFARAGLETVFMGEHPAGEVLATTLWAQGKPAAHAPAITPSTAEEITLAHAHIARYGWNAKQTLRHAIRTLAIAILGENAVGARFRRRHFQHYSRFFNG